MPFSQTATPRPGLKYSLAWSCLGALLASGCVSHTGQQTVQSGQASYYAKHYQGKQTASGQPFDHSALTAAHRSLPFGTRVKVSHQHSAASVVVTVTDRGPFVPGRVVDLTRQAFTRLAPLKDGVIPVTVQVVNLPYGASSSVSPVTASGGLMSTVSCNSE